MSVPRRTRLSLAAAATSGVVVAVMAGTALAVEDPSCSDLEFAEEAPAACESPSGRGAVRGAVAPRADGAPVTTPAAEPDVDDDEDGGCADFATQAAAQAGFAAGTGARERLDADDDGVACEEHFGTVGRQVAVYPLGGVATGGAAHR